MPQLTREEQYLAWLRRNRIVETSVEVEASELITNTPEAVQALISQRAIGNDRLELITYAPIDIDQHGRILFEVQGRLPEDAFTEGEMDAPNEYRVVRTTQQVQRLTAFSPEEALRQARHRDRWGAVRELPTYEVEEVR